MSVEYVWDLIKYFSPPFENKTQRVKYYIYYN